ncbi:MAG TPA: 2-hydroxychromene-2-carboxylate isomerase [Burkholderiales bacterium]|jgi:2-hydroxychromene-2-carboxylate isomerase|nr:2-hydroxychromene-2-carboxylate isomerase [Rhodospirillaceae bacterium]HMH16841.1 2-hydroxychromene-2-carboxylate isomerase [Burkholderiales bacterium]
MQVQFILDYRSPYAYLANTQIMSMGVQIEYKPVEIVSVMKRVNNQPSPMCPPKAKYAGLDAARWAKRYGVPYSPNRPLLEALRTGQLKSDLLSRAGIAAQKLGAFHQVNDALFGAVWGCSAALTSAVDRLNFLTSRALPLELWDIAESAEIQELLAANGEQAIAQGVFGVPTFFVDGEMFFGNDRLDFVKAKLDVARAKINQ